jgi:shikimate dehydrogenase
VKLAVIGDPVAHSRSPDIFARLLSRAGVDGSYKRVRVTTDELAAFLERTDLDGMSVTLPHKTAAHDLVDALTPRAARAGAVNCVFRDRRGLVGDNTDVAGVQRALNLLAPDLDLGGCRALILGASGAARAAALALEGSQLTIANRTLERAEALAAELGASALALDDALAAGHDLIVNATSVGLTDDSALLQGQSFTSEQVVLDMVYTPRVTPLLERALEGGARAVDGLWMLVFQALEQAERFGLPRQDVASALDLYGELTDDGDRAIIDAGRARIDEIDRGLLATLAERIRVAREIGPAKQALGLPVVRPERERELRAKHEAWAIENGLDPDYARALFDLVLERSRAEQSEPEKP